MGNPSPRSFTPEDRERSRSSASKAKTRETRAKRAEWRAEDALQLHTFGFVDGAISERLGVSEEQVALWLSGKRVRPKYGRGYFG